jgi:hypothetical protein
MKDTTLPATVITKQKIFNIVTPVFKFTKIYLNERRRKICIITEKEKTAE